MSEVVLLDMPIVPDPFDSKGVGSLGKASCAIDLLRNGLGVDLTFRWPGGGDCSLYLEARADHRIMVVLTPEVADEGATIHLDRDRLSLRGPCDNDAVATVVFSDARTPEGPVTDA